MNTDFSDKQQTMNSNRRNISVAPEQTNCGKTFNSRYTNPTLPISFYRIQLRFNSSGGRPRRTWRNPLGIPATRNRNESAGDSTWRKPLGFPTIRLDGDGGIRWEFRQHDTVIFIQILVTRKRAWH